MKMTMSREEIDQLPFGLYRIYWQLGGTSLAAVGQDTMGHRWVAPTNWLTPGIVQMNEFSSVLFMEPLFLDRNEISSMTSMTEKAFEDVNKEFAVPAGTANIRPVDPTVLTLGTNLRRVLSRALRDHAHGDPDDLITLDELLSKIATLHEQVENILDGDNQ